jgi:glyoxylase-like metal-dependent hydrolase (beta-lactamase superfamily II)
MTKLIADVFEGREATVNAYLVMNDQAAIVIDALRNREEAAELAERIRGTGRALQAVLVTHGHPDHYIGVRTLKEAFPEARILAASAAVKADILGFSTWMESVGWLDAQPQMKPRSAHAPSGFDYEAAIEVLHGDELVLEGGGALRVRSDYPATECVHLTTVHCPEIGALFTSDLCYHGVHAWAGQGVLRDHIANWVRVLGDLKAEHAGTGVTVYPGHGKPGGVELFDVMRTYLDDFTAAIDAARRNADATLRMTKLYPGHAQADFLLAHSVAFHGPDARS